MPSISDSRLVKGGLIVLLSFCYCTYGDYILLLFLSGADVFDRVSSFLETLHRDMKKGHCKENILLVSHGLTCRLFLMRYYHWEVRTDGWTHVIGGGYLLIL